MPSSANSNRRQKPQRESRPVDLEAVLQSLRLVLEMEPDYLDHAIDLLDEAIHHDRRKHPKASVCRV